MGVPNFQLTTIFSAKYYLTTIFWANSQLTTNFGWLLTFTFPPRILSLITRIFLLSASLSLFGVGPNKIKV